MVRARRLATGARIEVHVSYAVSVMCFPFLGEVSGPSIWVRSTHIAARGSLREPLMSERGQVTVMALGLALMSLVMAGLAVDGTKAFLLRRTLQNAADSGKSCRSWGDRRRRLLRKRWQVARALSRGSREDRAKVSGVPANRSPGVVEGRRGRRECRPEGKIRNPLPRACRDLRGARRSRK